jgi:hypothetical protein
MGTMVSAELPIGHEYNEKKSTMHRVLLVGVLVHSHHVA